MLDAEAFRVPGNRTGPPCKVATVLQCLPVKDRQTLQAALEDREVRHSVIESVLAREGIVLRQNVIGRHRRRDCACET